MLERVNLTTEYIYLNTTLSVHLELLKQKYLDSSKDNFMYLKIQKNVIKASDRNIKKEHKLKPREVKLLDKFILQTNVVPGISKPALVFLNLRGS